MRTAERDAVQGVRKGLLQAVIRVGTAGLASDNRDSDTDLGLSWRGTRAGQLGPRTIGETHADTMANFGPQTRI
jgi:hypothetical protein